MAEIMVRDIHASHIKYVLQSGKHGWGDDTFDYDQHESKQNLGIVLDEMNEKIQSLEQRMVTLEADKHRREAEEQKQMELHKENPALKDIWETYVMMKGLVTGEIDADFDAGERSVSYEQYTG